MTSIVAKRSNANNVSGRSSVRESILQESYLHWHKNHPHSTLYGTVSKIHTEEPETEEAVDKFVLQRKFLFCDCCRNPYVKCYRDLKRIRVYRNKFQSAFEAVYRNLRWMDLPGGQDLRAMDKNYWMHYMWLITYVTSEVDATNKDSVRHLRFWFEDVLYEAERLGIVLQEFFAPLTNLAQSRAIVEDIGELLKTPKRFAWLTAERKIMRLAIKPDSTIFTENRHTNFGKLLIYVRKDCQVWTRLQNLPEDEKVDLVSKGLMEISENFKELHASLVRPLRLLKATQKPKSCFRQTLISHVEHMRGVIKKVVQKKRARDSLIRLADIEVEDDKDKKILDALLEETSSHYDYIMRYGELLVEELWDIILMVRLCYSYVQGNSHNDLTVSEYETLMESRFKPKKRKKLLKPSHFITDDFFRVDCSETLRRLPVVVTHINTELCLHLYGHRNSRKSSNKHSSIPMHKFSMKPKRWNSGPKQSADENTTQQKENPERKTLMFVSAEGES